MKDRREAGRVPIEDWSRGQVNLQVRVRPRIKEILAENQEALRQKAGMTVSVREVVEALVWDAEGRDPEQMRDLIDRFREVAGGA